MSNLNRSKTAAPVGHRRALEVHGYLFPTVRIRCECGWSSVVLSQADAEAAYDRHLEVKK